jgi:hypothetical protein
MTDVTVRVERDASGKYRHKCGVTCDGIDWEPVGCSHADPRSAVDHAKRLSRPVERSTGAHDD